MIAHRRGGYWRGQTNEGASWPGVALEAIAARAGVWNLVWYHLREERISARSIEIGDTECWASSGLCQVSRVFLHLQSSPILFCFFFEP
jgi:hypothetical protein